MAQDVPRGEPKSDAPFTNPVDVPHGEAKNDAPFTNPVDVPHGEAKTDAPFTNPATPADPHPDSVLVTKLGHLGIVDPAETVAAARHTGLPIALAASILMQESSGGHNLWGHDPTIFAGGPTGDNRPVTRDDYLAYKAKRGQHGEGGMQGVGPCQLTWYTMQDQADAIGGCWQPLSNMQVGFGLLAESIRRSGLRRAVVAYNGSGQAAERYADTVLARADEYAKALGKPFR